MCDICVHYAYVENGTNSLGTSMRDRGKLFDGESLHVVLRYIEERSDYIFLTYKVVQI